jgi:DNA processing protein
MNEASTVLSDRDLRDAVAGLPGPPADREVLAARVAWSCLSEPGDGASGALVQTLGPVAALRAVERAAAGGPALDAPGLDAAASEAALARWRPRLGAALFAQAARAASRFGLAPVTPEAHHWPARLDDLGVHAPLALWVRGRPEALADTQRSVALVGARAATPYGEHVAGTLAGELSAQGVAVISGGAYGVDGAAHRAALGAGGATVAFVAGGADRVYPAAHGHLFARIAEGGAVVSEAPPGASPTKWRFLNRNRLIAAITTATVVVEAGWRSGSLNTAGHAAALGRPLGAVPGPVTSATSEGCHRLLREFDAACVTRTEDVLELLGAWSDAPVRDEPRPRAEATRVTDALAFRAWRSVEDIARRSGLSLSDVQAELGLLELDGRVASSMEGWRLAR